MSAIDNARATIIIISLFFLYGIMFINSSFGQKILTFLLLFFAPCSTFKCINTSVKDFLFYLNIGKTLKRKNLRERILSRPLKSPPPRLRRLGVRQIDDAKSGSPTTTECSSEMNDDGHRKRTAKSEAMVKYHCRFCHAS